MPAPQVQVCQTLGSLTSESDTVDGPVHMTVHLVQNGGEIDWQSE